MGTKLEGPCPVCGDGLIRKSNPPFSFLINLLPHAGHGPSSFAPTIVVHKSLRASSLFVMKDLSVSKIDDLLSSGVRIYVTSPAWCYEVEQL